MFTSVPDSNFIRFCHDHCPVISRFSGTESSTQFCAQRYKTFHDAENAASQGPEPHRRKCLIILELRSSLACFQVETVRLGKTDPQQVLVAEEDFRAKLDHEHKGERPLNAVTLRIKPSSTGRRSRQVAKSFPAERTYLSQASVRSAQTGRPVAGSIWPFR